MKLLLAFMFGVVLLSDLGGPRRTEVAHAGRGRGVRGGRPRLHVAAGGLT